MKKRILFLFTICFMVAVSAKTTVNAATWHRGTPAILRGNWIKRGNFAIPIKDSYKIRKNYIHSWTSNESVIIFYAIKYKRIGYRTYRFHALAKSWMFMNRNKGYKQTFTFKRVGNKMKVDFGYGYGWVHKTKMKL